MFDGIRYRWELRKLERNCAKVQAIYAKLRKNAAGPELEMLIAEEGGEVVPILEEIDLLKTKRYANLADSLMVPLPDRQDKELWEERRYGSMRCLSPKGFWELKKLIRQEKKERREALLAWLTAMIGIIGALTGLAAVLLSR